MSNSKRKFIDPMSCSAKVFMQHYGNCKKIEDKQFEPEICECCGKHIYATYARAKQTVRNLKTSHGRNRNRVSLRIYYCEYSNSFHLTHNMKYSAENVKKAYVA